jgi:hypothetical protein
VNSIPEHRKRIRSNEIEEALHCHIDILLACVVGSAVNTVGFADRSYKASASSGKAQWATGNKS